MTFPNLLIDTDEDFNDRVVGGDAFDVDDVSPDDAAVRRHGDRYLGRVSLGAQDPEGIDHR